MASFESADGASDTFRSILYFDPKPRRGVESVFAGPMAVQHYRQAARKGRFLQSLKAYLGDAGFTGTSIGGRHRTLPELIALILQRLLKSAEASLGPLLHVSSSDGRCTSPYPAARARRACLVAYARGARAGRRA